MQGTPLQNSSKAALNSTYSQVTHKAHRRNESGFTSLAKMNIKRPRSFEGKKNPFDSDSLLSTSSEHTGNLSVCQAPDAVDASEG